MFISSTPTPGEQMNVHSFTNTILMNKWTKVILATLMLKKD